METEYIDKSQGWKNILKLFIPYCFIVGVFQETIFGFNVSGRNTYFLIVTKENTINIWNGGNFGFEDSILSIILQLFAIWIVFLIFKNRLAMISF